MRSIIFALALVSTPAVADVNGQRSLEDELWAHASTAGSLETVLLFIETFPDGAYAADAKALAHKMQTTEGSENIEDALAGMVGDVTFEQPLAFGSEAMIGSSIAQLVKASPAFPPLPDLPEAYWKEQSCSNCHQWTREALCTQATIYANKSPDKYQGKRHPFGGLFKVGLSIWADGGCQ